MWGVCIMASIWEEYGDSSQKGNIVFVRKGDHKVELSVKTCGLCKTRLVSHLHSGLGTGKKSV